MVAIDSIEIVEDDDVDVFHRELVDLLKQAANCNYETNLRHLTITRPYKIPTRISERHSKVEPQINDKTGKEIVQLLTQITTNTNIKSIYIEPLWLNKECNDFLRMWYCQPFGNCNIPQAPNKYPRNYYKDQDDSEYDRAAYKTMSRSVKFVSVAKICDNDNDNITSRLADHESL